tara:strand:+ start:2001 stop:2687 length:687 start_codon:yes stop_codon:yes gene_type:complete
MKKLFIFDLDNTFYEYDEAHNLGLKKVFNSQEIFNSFDDFYSSYENVKKKVHTMIPENPSKHSKLIYFKNMFMDLNSSKILDFEEIYWSEFISKAKLQKKAIEMLKVKKDPNYVYFLFTNQNLNIQLRKIMEWKLNFFNKVITSEEAGYEKPHINFFNFVSTDVAEYANNGYKIYALGDDYDNDINYWVDNFSAEGYLINNSEEQPGSKNDIFFTLNEAIVKIFNNED